MAAQMLKPRHGAGECDMVIVESKVTRGVDPPEVEGYQWDGWKLIMIAKLNTDGTFHSRKWSCVWRPDIGSSL